MHRECNYMYSGNIIGYLIKEYLIKLFIRKYHDYHSYLALLVTQKIDGIIETVTSREADQRSQTL